MANNLVTEAYLAANFSPKSGITPGSDEHAILNCTEILARYNVTITPSTGNYCPKQSELTAVSSFVVSLDSYSEVDYLSSPTTSMSITLPASIQSGKLILFWVALNTDASITTPSGYTRFGHTSGGDYKSYALCYKLATGSEVGTSLSCTIGSSSYGTIGYAIFDGVKTSEPYVAVGDDYKAQYGTEINFNYAGVGYDGAMNVIIANTNLTSSGSVSHTSGYTSIGGYNRGNTNIPSVVYKLQSGNVWDNYSKTSSVNGYHNGIRIQIIPQ